MEVHELICDYCGKSAKGQERHLWMPEGWYLLGYHGQSFADSNDWRATHHFCSIECMGKAVKVARSK